MKQFVQNEEAVSPVIGVILMVAITVILAAVIAAFVFGMTGNVQTSKNVGITASVKNTSCFAVTIQGGSDLNALKSLSFNVNGTYVGNNGTSAKVENSGDIAVGKTYYIGGAANGAKLTVVGNFTDGAQQVLYDKTF